MMNLSNAKAAFDSLVNSLESDTDKIKFLNWVEEGVEGRRVGLVDPAVLEARIQLQKIAGELRSKVPLEGVMDTENIIFPTTGEDAGLTSSTSFHLDSFLFGEEEEENLVSEGLLNKWYCEDCGSRNTAEVTILTHSCSQERLEAMFRGLLPPLDGKTLLDVGSRLGAVLYGAFHHSAAERIVGVELNPELTSLAEEVIKNHKMGARVSVRTSNILAVPDLLKSAHVIVLNNVFEWFLPLEEQVRIWRYLKDTIRAGTLLVTIPSLEHSLEHLNTGISVEEWVEPVESHNPSHLLDQLETSPILLYRVRG